MMSYDQSAPLKTRLVKRDRLLVVNIDYTNSSLVEFLARNGADVIFVDCEQGDTDFESIPELVRAAHLVPKPVLVRVFSAEPWVVERYLMRGIDGIVVPRLETAEQVRSVVGAVKYCAANDGDRKAIVIQIETIAAARNIEEILLIDDVDAFFIGPVDLARSMGHGADYKAPEVAREIERLTDAIVKSRRSAGMLVTAETMAPVAAKGVNFLYLHTNDFLRAGNRALVSALDERPM